MGNRNQLPSHNSMADIHKSNNELLIDRSQSDLRLAILFRITRHQIPSTAMGGVASSCAVP